MDIGNQLTSNGNVLAGDLLNAGAEKVRNLLGRLAGLLVAKLLLNHVCQRSGGISVGWIPRGKSRRSERTDTLVKVVHLCRAALRSSALRLLGLLLRKCKSDVSDLETKPRFWWNSRQPL